MARGETEYSDAESREYLEGLGRELWDELIPEQVKTRLQEMIRKGIDELVILSDGDPMPWEILLPGAINGRQPKFLTEEFQVTRMLKDHRDDAPSFRVQRAVFVVPTGSPSTAEQEVEALEELLLKKGVTCATIRTLAELLDELKQAKFDLLHFSCHNKFKLTSNLLESSSIDMAGKPFTPTFLSNYQSKFNSRPLVFMNACSSAQAAPKMTSMSGWASKFRAAAAGAFVGTLWEVRDASAGKFATSWYSSMTDNRTVAESFQAARQVVNNADPTRLAFTSYVDPEARLVFS